MWGASTGASDFEGVVGVPLHGAHGCWRRAAGEGLPVMPVITDVGVYQGGPRKCFFFFLLRAALKDRPQGPPTANRQPLTSTNHQSPTATNRRQPPIASRHQPLTANRQPPTTDPHQPPIANRHQPPPTANRQSPPTANRQPSTANRQPPTATSQG